VSIGLGGASVRVEEDEDLAVGMIVGLDVPIGQEQWEFSARVQYLDTTFEGSGLAGGSFDVDFDPLMVGLGVGHRF
jgi:outer membrane protein W